MITDPGVRSLRVRRARPLARPARGGRWCRRGPTAAPGPVIGVRRPVAAVPGSERRAAGFFEVYTESYYVKTVNIESVRYYGTATPAQRGGRRLMRPDGFTVHRGTAKLNFRSETHGPTVTDDRLTGPGQ